MGRLWARLSEGFPDQVSPPAARFSSDLEVTWPGEDGVATEKAAAGVDE